jgi:hypothetical protein
MIQAATPIELQAVSPDPMTIPSLRLGDNAAARALLQQWMEDDSGYDEKVWPLVKEMIEENRLSERKRFAE